MKMVEMRYFKYLLRECGLNKMKFKPFFKDFGNLFEITYYAVMRRDETRIMDAIDLRNRFINFDISRKKGRFDQNDCDYDCFMCNDVNVFELLCALSIRMDLEIVGTPGSNRSGLYVVDMIKNIKADRSVDLNEAIIRWLNRDFRCDGFGSPFPLRHSGSRDMRKIELWDQMNAYIKENINENGDFLV